VCARILQTFGQGIICGVFNPKVFRIPPRLDPQYRVSKHLHQLYLGIIMAYKCNPAIVSRNLVD